MKAALLPDRGVVKVAGDDAGKFLNGLITIDTATVVPGHARYAALLTPQGKIIADFIVAAPPPEDGGGFFLDVPRALAPPLVKRLNLYRLRAKVVVEDLSEVLGLLAAWGGGASTSVGLSYSDPRLPELGLRVMLPPHLAGQAISDLGARKVDADEYEAHRIALGVPSGKADFGYSDAFPHEADMDQLHGVDFDKGCFVGQEVVSRMVHRGNVRTRVVPVSYDGMAPDTGTSVVAGDRSIGTLGSTAKGHGLALLRLDRAADAVAAGVPLVADGVELRLVKPSWARFEFPGEARAAE
jgi:folate-binding protein YgfZ